VFGRGGGWRGGVYGVEENRFEDGVWLSDHRMVVADVEVGNKLEPEIRRNGSKER
jgi:hypothetical protein